MVLIALAACATPARLAPEALRERAGKDEAALLKRVRVYADPRLEGYLAQVAERSSAACGVGACPPPRVTVIEDPTLAAFAMPGGRVFVHTGLLAAVENEAQLAVVLARELSHDTSRLGIRPSKPPMSHVQLGPTAAAIASLDLRLIASAAIEGYGAGGEREADEAAVRRVAAAGHDPGEAAKLFGRLAADGGERDGLAEIFFYGSPAQMRERQRIASELAPATVRAVREAAPAGEFETRIRGVVRDNALLDVRAGRFALARRQLDRVLASGADDPAAHVHDGEWYRLRAQRVSGAARAESVRQAHARYERALGLDPRSALAVRQLAFLRYQEGDLAGARAALTRYLGLAPAAPDARRMREYLAILSN